MRVTTPRTLWLSLLLVLAAPVAGWAEDAAHATLDQLSWMTGSWATTNARGSMEERWSKAAGGSKIGVFRSVNGDKMAMTELLMMEQQGDEVHLSLQQFNPGLVARADAAHFVAVAVGERDVVFHNTGGEGLYELHYSSQGPGDFRIGGRQAKDGPPFELVLSAE